MSVDSLRKVVRITASVDEAQILHFCEESGIVDKQITCAKDGEAGGNIFLVWFRSEETIALVKAQSIHTWLGGKPVTVDVLEDLPPSTQAQYRRILSLYCERVSPSPFMYIRQQKSRKETPRRYTTPSTKVYSSPSSTPTSITRTSEKRHSMKPTYNNIERLPPTGFDTENLELSLSCLHTPRLVPPFENETLKESKTKWAGLHVSSPPITSLYLQDAPLPYYRDATSQRSFVITDAFQLEGSSENYTSNQSIWSTPKDKIREYLDRDYASSEAKPGDMKYVTVCRGSKIGRRDLGNRICVPIQPSKYSVIRNDLEAAKESYSTSLLKLKELLERKFMPLP